MDQPVTCLKKLTPRRAMARGNQENKHSLKSNRFQLSRKHLFIWEKFKQRTSSSDSTSLMDETSCGTLSAFAENISIEDANVNRDLRCDGRKQPLR